MRRDSIKNVEIPHKTELREVDGKLIEVKIYRMAKDYSLKYRKIFQERSFETWEKRQKSDGLDWREY